MKTANISVPQLLEHLVEERHLLSAAYKSLADSRRVVRRVINRVKQKEKTKGNEQEATHAKGCAVNLEIELQMVCDGILALMDESLIHSASAGELQDHAAKTQDKLVDAVENAEVTEIKRAVYRALTRLRATIRVFEMIAGLETQAIDAYNDAHQYRGEDSLTRDQILTGQTVHKTVEVPRMQKNDRIVSLPVTAQCRVPTNQTTQRMVEVAQVQFLDRVVDVPVVMQRPAPQETIDTTQDPKTVSQDRIQQRTGEQITDTPVPQVVEEFVKVLNVFSQSRVQQRMVEQITETPAVSFDEEIMETIQNQHAGEDHLPFERGPIRVLRGMARTCVAQANPEAHR